MKRIILNWRGNLLIAAICLSFFYSIKIYAESGKGDPMGLWFLPLILPFYASIIVGIVAFLAGLVGAVRETFKSKKSTYILLIVTIIILIISWNRLLSMLK